MNQRTGTHTNPLSGILQLTTEQLQSIVELCPEPILIYSQYTIVYVNQACLSLIGAKSKQELLGKSIFDFLPPSHREETFRRVEELLAGSGFTECKLENEWIRLDGTQVYVQVHANIIDYGNNHAVLLLCKDITQQKITEQALRENEHRLHRMLKYSPEAIAVHCGGVITYVNEAIVQLFGADSEEPFLGRSILEFLHPDYHEVSLKRVLLAETTAEKLDKSIHKMVRLNGEVFDAEAASIKIYEDKERPCVQTVIRNVTDRIRYENALQESSSRYQRLVEFLPEPIVITDKGTIIYANKSAHKLVKMAKEMRLEGKSIFEFIHPEHHADSLKIVHRVMQSDDPSPFVERKLVCASGEVISVEISSIQIYNYSGKNVTLSVLRDLTERKNAEELLLRSEKLSVIGQLAAGVAHEIRNPLTALRGFTQLLQRELHDKYSYVSIMLGELDRINYIVNEFMSLAKPQSNQFEYKDIFSILKSVISILETQAIMNNVSIVLDTSVKLPPIYCDENQLKQVFVNVINNAVDAMKKDGGSLTISATQADNPELVSIKLTDQGPGIPSDIIQRLGEPFFTTKENGTGLGLMVCHRIVESHRGMLTITSEEGAGTTVEILLPFQAPNHA
jgi:PAS domain S-box-containing protein